MFLYKFNNNNVFCLLGPTTVGKSDISLRLIKLFSFEIVSIDSALIYKFMDIGTDKPSINNLKLFKHKLVNILDPKNIYTLNKFFSDINKILYKIIYVKKKIPLLVGGTMMYYNILFEGLSLLPSSNNYVRQYIKFLIKQYGNFFVYNMLKTLDNKVALKIHFNDTYRIIRNLEIFICSGGYKSSFLKKKLKFKLNLNFIKIIILFKDIQNYVICIKNRFYNMLKLGFKKEVLRLYNRSDLNINSPSIKCIGYYQMWLYLDFKISYCNMIKNSIKSTKYLVKKQLKWLKRWYKKSFIVYRDKKDYFDKIKNYIKYFI